MKAKETRWYLQMFADEAEGEGSPDAGDQTPEAEKGKEDESPKSALDDFLADPEHQAEFDRRIAKALEKQKGKLAASHTEELKKAKSEAEKLAKMNADQKKDYEIEKLKEENAKLAAEQERQAMSRNASRLMKEQGLDATSDVLDLVVAADAESTKANIDKLVAFVQEQVKAAEVKRATGSTPHSYGGGAQLTEMQKRIAKYKH